MKRFMLCIWMALLLMILPVKSMASQGGIPVGGIHILMTGVTGEPLQSAGFQILRAVRDEELGNHQVEKKMVKIGEEHRIMVVESFWTDRGLTGEKQTAVSTDEHGQAAIYGLNYGTYYLLETKAPEGYNKITSPIRTAIHKYSHLTQSDGIRDEEGKIIDNTLHIINVRYALPDTESWGMLQLAAAGTGLVFSLAAMMMLSRRKR